MYHRRVMIGVLYLSLLGSALYAADPAAIINADLLFHPGSVLQPFSGNAQFVGRPEFAQPCTISVNVTCLREVRTAERIRLEAGDAYGFVISPDSVVWRAPIDSGATLSALFVFQPQGVGTYQLIVKRRLKEQWQELASLILAISEDGETKYAGSTVDCRLNSIPPHPLRNSSPLIMHFCTRGATFDQMLDRHFTGELRFSRPPAVNDTTFIDFALECQVPGYSMVQFILDHSTNLRLSNLPRSWGEEIRLTDSTRFFNGRFWFMPVKSGIGVLNLRIVGKMSRPGRVERATTELPVYFVTDEDGKLIFLGNFGPWTRYKSKDDPMLGGLARLIDVKNRDYVLRHVLSRPNYQDDETNKSIDSTKTGNR